MHISFQKNKKNKSLWQRYTAGDKAAFGELYAHYHKSLTAFCIGRLKSIELAENVASETLMKLLQHPNPNEIENFEGWMFKVAKNVSITYLTKHQHRIELLDKNYKKEDNHPPEIEQVFSVENIDDVIRTSLDDKDYQIWQLHQQGYDNQEIAEIIKSTVKTVANRKSMARNKLKEVFKRLSK